MDGDNIFRKDSPGPGDVHVPTTEWDGKGKKGKLPKPRIPAPAIDEDTRKADGSRKLEPFDYARSKTPFFYGGNPLGSLREDQVPRFLGALTDAEKLPAKTVKLEDLVAMQNRVDTSKVKGIAEADAADMPPAVVVQHAGKKWIADGHHRLAADWLNGKTSAEVKFKNLEPERNTMKADEEDGPSPQIAAITKVDRSLGLVFGWAIICKVDGKPYFDVQGDHIPEEAMLTATADYMKGERVAGKMHLRDDDGEAVPHGQIVYGWPVTEDTLNSFGEFSRVTGFKIAMAPDDPDMLSKFESGEFTGFSIGGAYGETEEVE